jgi:hypothetical protein
VSATPCSFYEYCSQQMPKAALVLVKKEMKKLSIILKGRKGQD